MAHSFFEALKQLPMLMQFALCMTVIPPLALLTVPDTF
jgi:hypothetical protein